MPVEGFSVFTLQQKIFTHFLHLHLHLLFHSEPVFAFPWLAHWPLAAQYWNGRWFRFEQRADAIIQVTHLSLKSECARCEGLQWGGVFVGCKVLTMRRRTNLFCRCRWGAVAAAAAQWGRGWGPWRSHGLQRPLPRRRLWACSWGRPGLWASWRVWSPCSGPRPGSGGETQAGLVHEEKTVREINSRTWGQTRGGIDTHTHTHAKKKSLHVRKLSNKRFSW